MHGLHGDDGRGGAKLMPLACWAPESASGRRQQMEMPTDSSLVRLPARLEAVAGDGPHVTPARRLQAGITTSNEDAQPASGMHSAPRRNGVSGGLAARICPWTQASSSTGPRLARTRSTAGHRALA